VSHVIRYAKLLGRYRKEYDMKGGRGYYQEIYELGGIRVVTEAAGRIVKTVYKFGK